MCGIYTLMNIAPPKEPPTKKAYTANTLIRTVVQDRLKKVFKQNKINLADLIAFNRQQSQLATSTRKGNQRRIKTQPTAKP